MNLIIINSNSDGNSYVLQAANGEMLLVELGVQFDMIKKAVGFQLSKVAGALVSHEHGDHSKSIQNALSAGIKVWASKGTHEACRTIKHHWAKTTAKGHQFQVGSFKIMSFDIKHDCAEPLGFLIKHEECGTVLFLTDSYYCSYKFRDLNNIIIEANYSTDILKERQARGSIIKRLGDRVIESHMSLETCKKTLSANDLSQVNNIVLIHLSDRNSDARRFQREVQEATGKVVHVAYRNQIIPFNKTPF